jgi:hypothetical protein
VERSRQAACLVALGLIATISVAFAQDSSSVPTVAGTFRGTCVAAPGSGDDQSGEYRYTLGGRTLPALTAVCTPGSLASNVGFGEVWRSPSSTTLLMTQSMSAVMQTVRLIHFRAGANPLTLDLFGHDVTSSTRFSDTEFRLVHHVINLFQDTWDCEYDVNFATRIVSARLRNSRSSDITASVCEAEIEEIPLGPPPAR